MCACYTQMYTHVCTQRVCPESLPRVSTQRKWCRHRHIPASIVAKSLRSMLYTHMYIYVCTHVCMLYKNVWTCWHAKISTNVWTNVHTNICTWMYTQMYTQIFVHKCIHKCIHMSACKESLHLNTGTDTDMYLQASLLLKPSRQIIRELLSADCFAFSQFLDAWLLVYCFSIFVPWTIISSILNMVRKSTFLQIVPRFWNDQIRDEKIFHPTNIYIQISGDMSS